MLCELSLDHEIGISVMVGKESKTTFSVMPEKNENKKLFRSSANMPCGEYFDFSLE